MAIKLGILDQTIIYEGETAEDAFRHTALLAQKAEEWGYERFWVSEHHDSVSIAGSSPEVLISFLLARTERIRIGSGGIMLQHYSPYKVAENFNVLAALAPGRVDLGIGRAPGGLPRSTRALQQGITEPLPIADKISLLSQYIHDRLDDGHPFAGLRAAPIPASPADIYVLGATVESAENAGRAGLPYVFSQFINSDETVARDALAAYRTLFDTSKGAAPRAILALSAIVADTDEEAAALAGEYKLVKIHLESGRTITVGTLEQAEQFGKQTTEKFTTEVKPAEIVKGSKETVRGKLLELQRRYGADEFVITAAVKDWNARLRSFELLAEAFADIPAEARAGA